MEKEKKTVKKKLSLRWILVGAIAVYAVITLISQQGILTAQAQKKQELEAQQQELESQIAYLENEEALVGTDEYVERSAREKFGWVKEDEILFKESAAGQGGE
ncbi:MAG: septum formation initiator family protein [Christensenellaceae bacterium]|nr:septum formation initiator family protein [Christensenellaceae bacterium]